MPKTQKIRRQAEAFARIKTASELADALLINKNHLVLLAHHPNYKTFTIPKKNGGSRFIEDPDYQLKKVLQALNNYLQSSYFCHRSNAAYGFLINPTDDPDPRNMLTNAQKHIGRPWLLNMVSNRMKVYQRFA